MPTSRRRSPAICFRGNTKKVRMSRRGNSSLRSILVHFKQHSARKRARLRRHRRNQVQLATAKANQLKSQLDVEKYGPLAKVDAVSKQDLDSIRGNNGCFGGLHLGVI